MPIYGRKFEEYAWLLCNVYLLIIRIFNFYLLHYKHTKIIERFKIFKSKAVIIMNVHVQFMMIFHQTAHINTVSVDVNKSNRVSVKQYSNMIQNLNVGTNQTRE